MHEAPVSAARLSLLSVAQALGVHPFMVARVLGHAGELPPGLRFEPADVERMRVLAGLESWWQGDEFLPSGTPVRERALLRLLMQKMVERRLTRGHWTLAENVFRGLPVGDRVTVRRAVNTMLRGGILRSRASWRGLEATVDHEARALVEEVAGGAALPPELLEAAP